MSVVFILRCGQYRELSHLNAENFQDKDTFCFPILLMAILPTYSNVKWSSCWCFLWSLTEPMLHTAVVQMRPKTGGNMVKASDNTTEILSSSFRLFLKPAPPPSINFSENGEVPNPDVLWGFHEGSAWTVLSLRYRCLYNTIFDTDIALSFTRMGSECYEWVSTGSDPGCALV